MPVVLTLDCASGLITVTVRAPVAAVGETVTFIVIWVALVNVVEFTVTPPPFTSAAIRFGYPVPGSKNAEPPDEVPVITTFTLVAPRATALGLADEGAAGSGALSLITWTPHEFTA